MSNHQIQQIPCGPFANESERVACEKLRNRLQGTSGQGFWIFLTNIPFSFQTQGYSDEIDLIVVGPPGVIVIEIKHWDLTYIKENNNVVESEAERLNSKVKKIAGKLRKSFDVGFVEGRILLTRGDTRLITDSPKKVIHGITFYGLPDWQALLNLNEPARFDKKTVEAICKELEPKTKVSISGDIRTFAGLTNLEIVSPKDQRFHRVYKGIHISRRDKVILHLYDLSSSSEKNVLEIASREYETLQKLQKSSYLPRLLDSFQPAPEYPGEIYFFSLIDPEAPSLEERAKDSNWSFQQRLDSAKKLVQALDELHHPIDSKDTPIIHRNITPKSVKIKTNGQPLFTELDLAKLPNVTTVSTNSISFEGKENYVAPEVLKGGLGVADKRSDVYSLCASLKVLFEDIPEDTTQVLSVLQKGLTENPENRIQLKALTQELQNFTETPKAPEKEIIPVEYWDEDYIVPFQKSYYKILNRLGSGGIGATFKVMEVDQKDEREYGTYVAKIIFDKEDGESAIQAYRKVRAHSVHPHLAVVYEIAPEWERNNFIALMKWVEGMPFSDLTGVLPLYIEELGEKSCEFFILRGLYDLCNALVSLHNVGLVHGDITPKNIIISGGDVTLTDYDAVIETNNKPRFDTHMYSSSTVQKQKSIQLSDDVFALAASFFHVLFEHEPFRFGEEFKKDTGLNWGGIERQDWSLLSEFFDKATHPDYKQRFCSAIEAKLFLKQLLSNIEESGVAIAIPLIEQQKLTPNEVPWLLDLLRSYPGSRRGNEETRGLDSAFAEHTYVETHLDKALLDEIYRKEVNLVILFGNAGDGKTAFLQHLALKLGLGKHHSSERLWDHTLKNGIRIRANMDGAASFQGKTATELLDEFFVPFQECNPPNNLLHLIAINSGPLQAWIVDYEQRNKKTRLTEQLQGVLDGNVEQLDPRIRFLDLNIRSLVGGITDKTKEISTDFLDNLLENLLGKQQGNVWQPCHTCIANNYCSAWESVQTLRNEQKGERVRKRLYEVLQAVHHRGEIHITARELRAALSYIFFGIYYCTDLHQDLDIRPGHYYDRAFDPTLPARQGEVLQELTFFDPALEAHPKIDRYLLGQNNGGEKSSPQSYPKLPFKSARRRAYFEWDEKDIAKVILDKSYFGLARCRHLERFRRVPLMSEEEKTKLCADLCNGIAKLEDLPTLAFSDKNGVPLKITPRTPTESILWVVKPFDRFSLEAKLPTTVEGLEKLHTHLVLKYKYADGNYEELIIGAELFHILMELKDGVQLSDAASDDTFANLSIFTQRLAHENSREFSAWNPVEEVVVFKIKAELKDDIQKIICTRVPQGR